MWYIYGMDTATPQLVDQWLFRRDGIPSNLPNRLCIIKETNGHFAFVQYSELYQYDGSTVNYGPPIPVCVYRCPIISARSLWYSFVADSWTPVNAATPEGCALASTAYRAISYRDSISKKEEGIFSGIYLGELPKSDPKCCLFFVEDFGNNLTLDNLTVHPVTGMPRGTRSTNQPIRRSNRKMYQTVQTNKTVTKTYLPIDYNNYALGA